MANFEIARRPDGVAVAQYGNGELPQPLTYEEALSLAARPSVPEQGQGLAEAVTWLLLTLRCENPVKVPLPNPEGYREKNLLNDCGECRYCKVVAALAASRSEAQPPQDSFCRNLSIDLADKLFEGQCCTTKSTRRAHQQQERTERWIDVVAKMPLSQEYQARRYNTDETCVVYVYGEGKSFDLILPRCKALSPIKAVRCDLPMGHTYSLNKGKIEHNNGNGLTCWLTELPALAGTHTDVAKEEK